MKERLTGHEYQRVMAATDRGAIWLLDHLDEDGRFHTPVGHDVVNRYHKIPLALIINGYWGMAGRVLDHFARTFVRPQGLVEIPGPFSTNTETYIESWTVWAAQLAGRYGLAQTLGNSVEAKMHPELGGAFDDFDDRDAKCALNLEIQGGAGMTMLILGRIEQAVRVGCFAQHAWRSQGDRDSLYNYFDYDGKPVVDFPPEQTISYVLRRGGNLQPLANLGFLINFLIKLDSAAPGRGFLETARSYFDWAADALPDHDSCPQHHKFAWAAAMRYQLTPAPRYFQISRSLCVASAAAQETDGGWRSPILCEDYATQPLAITVAMTTDSSTWPRLAAQTLGT